MSDEQSFPCIAQMPSIANCRASFASGAGLHRPRTASVIGETTEWLLRLLVGILTFVMFLPGSNAEDMAITAAPVG
jgi:hypothetical protein